MVRVTGEVPTEPGTRFASMIDIVFLLLVFFILQPFKYLHSDLPIQADVPDSVSPVPHVEAVREPVILWIFRDPEDGGEVFFEVGGNVRIPSSHPEVEAELASALQEATGGDAATPIHLTASADLPFRHVITALEALRLVGLANIRFESVPVGGDGADVSGDSGVD